MIPKSEILELARNTNLRPHVVEKDYVLSWILAGINQHEIGNSWVFKGGTCLKKCYFDSYRFSEDLDFTLIDESHLDEVFLMSAFNDIGEWIYEQSGIEIPADKLIFDIYQNRRGSVSCQGRIFYKGPVSPSSPNSFPRIKLDLTADEILVEPAVRNRVRHDYSDFQGSNIYIKSYSYEEVFAEKTRALAERTRPRDLYDVINFYRRPESEGLAGKVRQILEEKCDFKSIPMPSIESLVKHEDECRAGWEQQLSHQLQFLPPFDSYWSDLLPFLHWLNGEADSFREGSSAVPPQHGAILSSGPNDLQLVELSGLPVGLIDRLRFAASNHLCIRLDYRKETGQRNFYLLEPYSLNRTSDGFLLLHAIKHETGQIRSFRTDRMFSAEVTDIVFSPSYRVDLIPRGLSSVERVPTQARPVSRIAKPKQAKKLLGPSGLTYIFECPICAKKFKCKTMNGKLNKHKDKNQWDCPGRMGLLAETKY